MRWRINRKWRVVMMVLMVLVVLRLSLPFIVSHHVNIVLNELEGYRGSIDNVNIHLLQGRYQIHGLKIFKIKGNAELPFVEIPITDLSIEWSAILQGAIVGDVKLQEPTLNFISGHKNDNGKIEIALNQFGKGLDWLKPLKKLFPFDINRLTVYDGKIAYYDFTTDPKVRLHLQNIHLDALNLTNAKGNPEELPSRIYLQALSTGNGELNLTMKINVQKLVPDIDMDLSFKNINMRALLDFCKAYANVEVENGDFNLYAEMAVIKGKFSGYVKPIFNEMEFVDWNKSQHKSFQLMWETMLNALIESFENKRINQYAPSITLRGEIAQSDISFWPALWNVFTNGFVQSFDYKNDRAVSFASSNISGVSEFDESKSKAELKRKKRKEKRERKLKAKKDLKGKIRKRKS